MNKEIPPRSAQAQVELDLDPIAMRDHIRTCPRDHFSNGECVPEGGHPFLSMVNEFKSGERSIDEQAIARALSEVLAPFVELIEAVCVRCPNGLAVENMFDASHLSERVFQVHQAFGTADFQLTAAHSKKEPGTPGVYSWSPTEDPEHSLLAGTISRVRRALRWPADRHNDVARHGKLGDQFRARDVIAFHDVERLRSALASLKLLARRGKKSASLKGRRNPGRPLTAPRAQDARVKAAWDSGQYKRIADLDPALGLASGEGRRALDRNRKAAAKEKAIQRGAPRRQDRGTRNNSAEQTVKPRRVVPASHKAIPSGDLERRGAGRTGAQSQRSRT